MNGHTHQVGAILSASILLPTVIQNESLASSLKGAIFLGGALIGGLLPDADMQNSTMGKRIYPVAWPMYLLRSVLRLVAVFIPKFKAFTKTLGHRGISHSPFLWIVVLLPACILSNGSLRVFFLGMALGVLSHLLLDIISGGIPLLLPFSSKRVHIPGVRIKTGSWGENVVLGILSALLLLQIMRIM